MSQSVWHGTAQLTAVPRLGLLVPAGFFSSYNFSNLQPNVSTAVAAMLNKHPGAHVYIIGHSMGAAVATICAIDVKYSFNLTRDQIHLYTFGSPRVGNDVFAAFLHSQIRVGPLCLAAAASAWQAVALQSLLQLLHGGSLWC